MSKHLTKIIGICILVILLASLVYASKVSDVETKKKEQALSLGDAFAQKMVSDPANKAGWEALVKDYYKLAGLSDVNINSRLAAVSTSTTTTGSGTSSGTSIGSTIWKYSGGAVGKGAGWAWKNTKTPWGVGIIVLLLALGGFKGGRGVWRRLRKINVEEEILYTLRVFNGEIIPRIRQSLPLPGTLTPAQMAGWQAFSENISGWRIPKFSRKVIIRKKVNSFMHDLGMARTTTLNYNEIRDNITEAIMILIHLQKLLNERIIKIFRDRRARLKKISKRIENLVCSGVQLPNNMVKFEYRGPPPPTRTPTVFLFDTNTWASIGAGIPLNVVAGTGIHRRVIPLSGGIYVYGIDTGGGTPTQDPLNPNTVGYPSTGPITVLHGTILSVLRVR